MWLIVGAAVILAGIGWWTLSADSDDSGPKGRVETMSPDRFTGRTRSAYQAAKEIPEILDQLPCYCGCMLNFGHESNLFCFKDQHGEGCALCQDIAIDARDLHRKGEPIERIRDTIRTRYAMYAP